MKELVVCVNNVTINSGKVFTKGCHYFYEFDSFEKVCDEQVFHRVDKHLIPYNVFIENFKFIDDWRDIQIKTIVNNE